MTESSRPARVLVVSHGTAFTPALVTAVRERALRSPARFRLVVPNPARGEVHLLHPERHDKADEAERDLLRALPALEAAAGGHVIASVSVRNNPMDAIEEILFGEPVDEIVLALARHPVAERLHQDLAHRLHHYGLPITMVGETSTS
ncbi:MAG: hypothetical protein JWN91_3110 [Nocardioides sp.]|jgi:hypothetical protein|nr:hypothetical protein [Nocardioides sp.]